MSSKPPGLTRRAARSITSFPFETCSTFVNQSKTSR
jgi:hypothetical protein